jgi:hypothetical protein
MRNNAITKYWLKYYFNGNCVLCGNYGWLNTKGTVTPAGIPVGVITYCICPNGQALRKQEALNIR